MSRADDLLRVSTSASSRRQAHATKCAFNESRERLVHKAVTPVGTTEDIPQLGSRALFLESEQKAGTDRQTGGLADNGKLKAQPAGLDAVHPLELRLRIRHRRPPCVWQERSDLFT
jgi:hypothetical protein